MNYNPLTAHSVLTCMYLLSKMEKGGLVSIALRYGLTNMKELRQQHKQFKQTHFGSQLGNDSLGFGVCLCPTHLSFVIALVASMPMMRGEDKFLKIAIFRIIFFPDHFMGNRYTPFGTKTYFYLLILMVVASAAMYFEVPHHLQKPTSLYLFPCMQNQVNLCIPNCKSCQK